MLGAAFTSVCPVSISPKLPYTLLSLSLEPPSRLSNTTILFVIIKGILKARIKFCDK